MALDPSVVLLIGADAAVVDESSYTRPITLRGNAARTTSQSKFGGASVTFDGTGDWLEIPSSTDFSFGAGDFTVEAWVRFLVKSDSQAIFGRWGPAGFSWFLYITSGSLTFTWGAVLSFPFVPTLGQWYHLAADRFGNTLRIYRDGAVLATFPSMPALSASTEIFTVGAIGTSSTYASFDFNGQMDEVRIIKGVAMYNGAFTPPAGPFTRGVSESIQSIIVMP